VILCGVAGADATADKSLNIGDVVIGESVINYEDGTIYEAGKQIHRSKVRNAAASAIPAWRFRPRSDRNSWGVMETSLFRIADALCNSWVFGKSGLQQMGLDVGNLEVTGKFQIKDAFDARSTVIGSGSKVVSACQYFPDMIRFASEKIDTVETEAAGVCRACAMARPAKTALVVRGIMDHANRRTRGGKVKKVGRLIANASCSHFVFTLLQSLDSGK
jgi:nucleoside phosphorylase